MLKIENLSKRYPNGIRALRDVSLEIPRGVFGLLGPNGAGKTTLMRTLATLQEADEGRAVLGDIDLLADKQEARKALGYLPQEFGVYPAVTAEAMLQHLAILKGLTEPRQRTAEVTTLLHRTNLFEARKRRLSALSGGTRRRFGIAQALLGRPRLLILDEPTAGLDPEERRRFLNLFSEIAEDVVVILSTHIVDDVSDLCTQMAILDGGELRLAGDPARLSAELEGQVWKKVVARDELATLEGRLKVLSSRLRAGLTEVRVLSPAPPGGGFEPSAPDLTDVYFAALLEGPGRARAECG